MKRGKRIVKKFPPSLLIGFPSQFQVDLETKILKIELSN